MLPPGEADRPGRPANSSAKPWKDKSKPASAAYSRKRRRTGTMLEDSAHIQEMEAEWTSRRSRRHGGRPVAPLYTRADAAAATKLLTAIPYGETFSPAPGITAIYHDAGHILGSAFIELSLNGNGSRTRLLFSGDLGRPDQLLVNNPDRPVDADYLFLEGTYGDRDHKDESQSRAELQQAIDYSYARGGKVIIPAFAVERTQEVLYCLHMFPVHPGPVAGFGRVDPARSGRCGSLGRRFTRRSGRLPRGRRRFLGMSQGSRGHTERRSHNQSQALAHTHLPPAASRAALLMASLPGAGLVRYAGGHCPDEAILEPYLFEGPPVSRKGFCPSLDPPHRDRTSG